MNGRPSNDRDEFERLVQHARMERAVYLSEVAAGAASAFWKRVAGLLRGRAYGRPLAAG